MFSLYLEIHSTTNFRSLLVCLLSFFDEFSLSKRLLSSAKWCTVEDSTALWKSLMKRIKGIGANIDPWGTPILIVLSKELVLLIVVCCFLSSRNDLNHLTYHIFHSTQVYLKVYHDLLCWRPFRSQKILHKQIFQNQNFASFFCYFY